MSSSLSTLSNRQKTQIRNAFKLIDGESRDALITKTDLVKLYKTLGINVPSNATLKSMLEFDGNNEEGINFTQFSKIIADELAKLDDKNTIYNALRSFTNDKDNNESLEIEVDKLKSACCSVQLGELGSGDHKLSPHDFESIIKGYVKETIDGKKLFLAQNWLDNYIE
ncbi:uncharacterized protein RJT21DRAFT_3538 [Scheffersomyces amazonensis]|uniref:uncharacterized protein n=1 Tax=Scheffersomyces amazonensis TaxID=1078765 RepID=UPI00315C84F7